MATGLHWATAGRAGGRLDIDWSRPGRLDRVDPYFVWLSLTDLAGFAPPGSRDLLLPTLRYDSRRTPSFRTHARTLRKSHGLLSAWRNDEFRSELGLGVASETGQLAVARLQVPGTPAGFDRRQGGRRPVLGIIDYGCAFAHPSILRRDSGGQVLGTRLLALWNQGDSEPSGAKGNGHRPLRWRATGHPFSYGWETHRDLPATAGVDDLALDDYILQYTRDGRVVDDEACYRDSGYGAVMGRRATHGTHVMSMATGWPDPLARLEARPAGAPHDWDIVFVQLPRFIHGRQVTGLLRANVYDALRYIQTCAPKASDIVVNLSYGANAGPHDGSTVLEQAIDAYVRRHAGKRRFEVVIPAGNARDERMHLRAELEPGQAGRWTWRNLPDDPSDSFVELWLPDDPQVAVRIQAPGGDQPSCWLRPGQARVLQRDGRAVAALVAPHRASQSPRGRMVLLATRGTRPDGLPTAPYGGWTLEVANGSARPVTVQAWCERDNPAFGSGGVPRQARFDPCDDVSTDNTLNSIAHGQVPRVVGARWLLGGGVTPYSGRQANRPIHHAPGDEHPSLPGLSAAALFGSDTVRLNGTSVAAAAHTRRLIEGRS